MSKYNSDTELNDQTVFLLTIQFYMSQQGLIIASIAMYH